MDKEVQVQKPQETYGGYEVGPIRPPSEAHSLLLRLTRNCPWNHCKFCPIYKGTKFSIRPKEHVFKDIDLIKKIVDALREGEGTNASLDSEQEWALHAGIIWYQGGLKSIFLQDANSLIIKPDDLVAILTYIKSCFPEVERITSYARSHTIARISDGDMHRIAQAGLNRIHIGLESGCDSVLELVKKGASHAIHIKAGLKVKRAGIQLSEYYMPGLGGNEYWRENALDTAQALNEINPDFILIRTLVVPASSELAIDYNAGVFTRTNDVRMVEELRLMIENLEGITSTIKSDHILNLLPQVEGVLPTDKENLLGIMTWFLELSPVDQLLFRVGRRTNIMHSPQDLIQSHKRARVEEVLTKYSITQENVDQATDLLMSNFV